MKDADSKAVKPAHVALFAVFCYSVYYLATFSSPTTSYSSVATSSPSSSPPGQHHRHQQQPAVAPILGSLGIPRHVDWERNDEPRTILDGSPPSSPVAATPPETVAAIPFSPPVSASEDGTSSPAAAGNRKFRLQRQRKRTRKDRRIFIISFLDATSGYSNTGLKFFAAKSRECYAKMHGYEVRLYSDKDLDGWFAGVRTADGGYSNWMQDIYNATGVLPMAAALWSKNFLMKRTMVENKLEPQDWVFWLDGDTMITNPQLTIEEIVRKASEGHRHHHHHHRHRHQRKIKMHDANKTSNDDNTDLSTSMIMEPDLIVSDTQNGLNNGVYGMRPTDWSFEFLQLWWEDQDATQHAADNGPFMHAVLRGVTRSLGYNYTDDCSMKKDPSYTFTNAFIQCYIDIMHRKGCKDGYYFRYMSRCPRGNFSYDNVYNDSIAKSGKDFEMGSIPRYSPHVGGHCKINSGLTWAPLAQWDPETSWLLHLAGMKGKERNRIFMEKAKIFKRRFKPVCEYRTQYDNLAQQQQQELSGGGGGGQQEAGGRRRVKGERKKFQ